MLKVSLVALARKHLEAARGAKNGRSSEVLYGGHEHQLRQAIIALREGTELAEHDGPPEATMQVLEGTAELVMGTDSWKGMAGDLIGVPTAPHSVRAVTDTAFILTVRTA